MNTNEIIKKYSIDKSHLESVSRLSVLLFNKIKNIFEDLKNYDNENDLKLLKTGALLHDIGINFSNAYNLPHHKAGAKFIFENKPDEITEEELEILCCLIRYHRKSFPSDEHEFYKNLNNEDKLKVNRLGAIIRLADGLDSLHINLIEDFSIDFDNSVLTLIFGGNIMLNIVFIKTLQKKKLLFEEVFKTNVRFRGEN